MSIKSLSIRFVSELPSLRLLIAGLIFALTPLVSATSEADLDPGPSTYSTDSSSVAPSDIATSTNTTTYPSPAAPRLTSFPAQRQPSGVLSGRIIYTNGGHGYHAVTGGWGTDRPTYQNISEDLGNQDQMTQLVYQAFNAGATVVPMRPVGNQVNEVIVDNNDPQVTYFGSWSNSVGTPYYGEAGDAITYRFAAASASETATARYTPNIPVAGFYPVYGWARSGTDRCVDQLYRIKHTGGISEVTVNHRKVGKGWVYLGSYYFAAGTGGYCEISNESASPAGSNAIADAIRFGNGMGDIDRGSGVSGKPREEEACRYWIQAMMGKGSGSDSSVYDRSGLSDGDDNVGAPIRMAAYMNTESLGAMTDRVFLSFHSNGGGGSARGAEGLYNNTTLFPGTGTPNQLELARLEGAEVNQDMRGVGSPPLENAWSGRTSYVYARGDYAFGEIRWDSINHEMDATINEVAYHDNTLDAQLLADSKARVWIARAALQGLIRYFNQFGGGSLGFPPEPPTNIKAVGNLDGTVNVSWNAPAATSIGGDVPTGYMVYKSTDGYGFGSPIIVNGAGTTQAVLTGIAPNVPLYLRVACTNFSGESMPSEVLAVSVPDSGTNRTLIVSGFDRMDRFQSPLETNTGLTAFRRAKPWLTNNYDYIVQHAAALKGANRDFDSVSNEALTQALLGNYKNVIWIAGEESTDDHTFSASEQTMITSYLANGGNLFVTGAEVGWDLDLSNNGRTFFRNTLGATYVSDDAGTYNVSAGTGVFAGIGAFTYGPAAPKNNTAYPPAGYPPYDAEYADVINPSGAGSTVLTYSSGASSAVRTVSGESKVIVFGFPFECITNSLSRSNLMTSVLNDFDPVGSGVQDWNLY